MRRGAIMAAVLLLGMAMGGAAAVDSDQAARPLVGQVTRLELVELGYLAGLRSRQGEPLVQSPLRVAVVQEGGPLWVSEVVAREVVADGVFELGESPHLVRAEVVREGPAWAMRLGLFRQGWDLRTPSGGRFHVAPWVTIASGLAGALALARLRRWGWGLLVAGLVAQLGASTLRWPAVLPKWSVVDALSQGFVARWVIGVATRLSENAVPIGAGLIVLCLLLMAFDHRRSPRRGGMLLAAGLGGLFGALAWIEAAVRTGLTGWGTTAFGAVALSGMLGSWALAFTMRRPRGA